MANFLKIVGAIFFVAFIIVGSNTLWKYSNFYGNGKAFGESEGKTIRHANYAVKKLSTESEDIETPPVLPDISSYTVENIKNTIPDLKEGSVTIENLNKGFRKLRAQSDIFGDMQERLDPLAIVLNDGVHSLDGLVKKIDDYSILEKTEDGEFILHVPLSIRAESTFIIQEGETLYLNSNSGGILSNFGTLYIIDATVMGWNLEAEKPAYFVDKESFRPYITTWCGSHLYIAGSTVAHLGYENSKSYGVTYTSCSDSLYRDHFAHLMGGTGAILENNFTDMYFGFYSYEVSDVTILRNKYNDNIVYAIDPHDRSSNLIVAYNEIYNTREKHGIIFSRDVTNSFIFDNISDGNTGSGIMLDRNSGNNVVAYNTSRNNGGDGLTYYESPDNISYKNKLLNNKKVGLRIRNSWNISSHGDVINGNRMGIRLYTDYLLKEDEGSKRNLEIDPYTQKASVTLKNTEMVGNIQANFKFTDFDKVEIYKPVFFKTPSKLFSGDLGVLPRDLIRKVLFDNDGVSFEHKKSIQN